MNLKSKYFTKLVVAAALCMSGTAFSMEIVKDKESKTSHFSCPTVEFLKTVEYEVTFEDKVQTCLDIMKHIGTTGIKEVVEMIPINFQKVEKFQKDDPELEVYIKTVQYSNALSRAFYGTTIDEGLKRIEKPSNEEDLKNLLKKLDGKLKKIVYHDRLDENPDLFQEIDPISLFTNYVYPIKFVCEGQSYKTKVMPETLKDITQFSYIEVSNISGYLGENQYYGDNPINCFYKTSSGNDIAITTYAPAFSVLQYKNSIREEHSGVNFFNPNTVFVRQDTPVKK